MSRWDWLKGRRKRMMEDLDQDMRDYIERETQDNIERGLPPEEARYAVRWQKSASNPVPYVETSEEFLPRPGR